MHPYSLFALLILSLLSFQNNAKTFDKQTSLGVGNTVLYNGKSYPLVGVGLTVGHKMPCVDLVNEDGKRVNTLNNDGLKTIYFIIPSVDEPLSTEHIIKMSQTNFVKPIRLLFLSSDSVHTLKRFKFFHQLHKMTFLTDSRTHGFGLRTGTLIFDQGELTRAIIVTDENNQVLSIQANADLLELPSIMEALTLI